MDIYIPGYRGRFIPYMDDEIDLSKDPYEGKYAGPDTEVDDDIVEKHISRILVNTAIDLAEGRNLDEESIPQMYRYRAQHDELLDSLGNKGMPRRKHNKPKHRKHSRRSRDSSETARYAQEVPPGSEVSVRDGTPVVTMPLPLLKQYMLSEVESRVRYINQHYERRHEFINKDRLSLCADVHQLKLDMNELILQLESVATNNTLLRLQLESTRKTEEAKKESQRKRRQAKRHRKNAREPMASMSDSNATGRNHVISAMENSDTEEMAEVAAQGNVDEDEKKRSDNVDIPEGAAEDSEDKDEKENFDTEEMTEVAAQGNVDEDEKKKSDNVDIPEGAAEDIEDKDEKENFDTEEMTEVAAQGNVDEDEEKKSDYVDIPEGAAEDNGDKDKKTGIDNEKMTEVAAQGNADEEEKEKAVNEEMPEKDATGSEDKVAANFDES